jgi:hypothetical protein
MKISKNTFDIMKNFSAINNSMWVKEDHILKTISVAENIIGVYDTEETFPEWQFYNSVPFISMVSLFSLDKVDFDFGEKAVIIKMPGLRTTIVYDSVDLIPILSNLKDATVYKKFSDFDATFSLTSDKIVQIQKAANILGLPDMTIKMKDGKGLIVITDDEDPDSNIMKMSITGEGDCEVTVMVKNMQVLAGNYDISISNDVLANFHHEKLPLFYIIAAKKG